MKKALNYFVFAALPILLLVGCAKEYNNPSNAGLDEQTKKITDPKQQKKIEETIENLPRLAVYSEHIDKYILIDFNDTKNGFNFASPNAGFSFSAPSDFEIIASVNGTSYTSSTGSIQFVQAPDGTYYQVATVESAGGGGGTVTAGDITLNVEFVLCFNSGDDFFGLDLFDVGLNDSFGISGAIGIGGNFSAIMEMSEEELSSSEFSDFLTGFVAYMVFDGTPEGSYDVIDLLVSDEEPEESELSELAIAYFFSFEGEGGIFFSADGTLSFNGGSASFDGTYLGLSGFFSGILGEGSEEPDFVEVDGSGTLNCQ